MPIFTGIQTTSPRNMSVSGGSDVDLGSLRLRFGASSLGLWFLVSSLGLFVSSLGLFVSSLGLEAFGFKHKLAPRPGLRLRHALRLRLRLGLGLLDIQTQAQAD